MITIQVQYSNLIQGVIAHAHARTFPAGTVFRQRQMKGRLYWYARLPDGKERYVGKNSPEILEVIRSESNIIKLDNENVSIVKAIIANGYPVPQRELAKTVRGLSDAGFFRLRGVLVGTLAYQTYFPMFGELPINIEKDLPFAAKSSVTTSDADVALFHSISVAVDDKMDEPLSKIIAKALPFRRRYDFFGDPMPSWQDDSTGVSIDLLSPLRGIDDNENTFLPSIGEETTKLKFLDFLIYDEMQAALLDGSGIVVNVPRPERFAVHKFIISQVRKKAEKRMKDMAQAITLSQYFLNNDPQLLRDAFSEAYNRGPGWRKRLNSALEFPHMPQKMLNEFNRIIQQRTKSIKSKSDNRFRM